MWCAGALARRTGSLRAPGGIASQRVRHRPAARTTGARRAPPDAGIRGGAPPDAPRARCAPLGVTGARRVLRSADAYRRNTGSTPSQAGVYGGVLRPGRPQVRAGTRPPRRPQHAEAASGRSEACLTRPCQDASTALLSATAGQGLRHPPGHCHGAHEHRGVTHRERRSARAPDGCRRAHRHEGRTASPGRPGPPRRRHTRAPDHRSTRPPDRLGQAEPPADQPSASRQPANRPSARPSTSHPSASRPPTAHASANHPRTAHLSASRLPAGRPSARRSAGRVDAACGSGTGW
ncbi:hypothetical protein S1361_23790 [Streptomyces cyanogenus]|uniref:Uncharacterized protein n=1 Tax=Streptomyces cyanogenus TaxID=80860 RepID=A0ABX7TWZ7_STRCY|nr:hypothetical protein S1361_23790 [Streptomyces cyanogenus]